MCDNYSMERKIIKIGNVAIGGDAPVSVQSMTTTRTSDTKATLKQISELAEAGCEIIRLAVLNQDCANAIKEIKKKSPIPVVADIHFDYRLALTCLENGVDGLRLNPGNIGGAEHVKAVVNLAKKTQTPIRIGVNGGSLEKEIEADSSLDISEKMVKSALGHIKMLEECDFDLIKVSLKSSDVPSTIGAYRLISTQIPYPLHLGITEAGTLRGGMIKSAIGIGTLLSEGIGNTIRVSLTEDPVEEVKVALEILKALKLREKGVNFVSCPTCGRCQIDLINLAKEVEKRFTGLDAPITIATMGCAVNGPNEAKHADYGIAGGINEGYIFKKGEFVKKVSQKDLLDEFERVVFQDLNR